MNIATNAAFAQQRPMLSAEQNAHYLQFADLEQRHKAGNLRNTDYFQQFYQPIAANCRELQRGYAKLAEEAQFEKDNAEIEGNTEKAQIAGQLQQIYQDFSRVCQDICDAYEKKDSKAMNRAIARFVEIERFVLGRRLKCLGRNWLTKDECQDLLRRGYGMDKRRNSDRKKK